MNYINNFRYGEISRKNAGRFDTEYYGQSAFRYLNMKTGSVGGASRRPPLKKLVDDVDVLDIREFTISDSLSFIVGIGIDRIRLYRFSSGQLTEISSQEYPKYNDKPIITKMDEKTAREIRTCQYYDRMYFAHRSFRTFHIDLVATLDNFTISPIEILLNQYAKQQFYFTPSVVKDEKGNELPGLEKRLVYYNESNKKWYFDKELTDEYIYVNIEGNKPIKASSTYIENFNEPQDDSLMTGEGHYPSEIACINDCLYMGGTDLEPQVIWKSRVLGSSQYIEGYTPDSMHDFITFQSVVTESKDLVSSDDMPTTDMKDASGNPVYETDSTGRLIYYGTAPKIDANGEVVEPKVIVEVRLYWKPASSDLGNKDKLFYTDPDLSSPYVVDADHKSPFNKPLKIYDLSDVNKLMITVCRVDFVTTDSCADRIELNTGRNDRVMFIRPACGKIIIGTTSSEETLPSNFSPVSNRSREHYSDFGSKERYSIAPICMNSSMYFVQRTNSIREFHLNQGFILNSDVTLLNHDAFKENVISLNYKNTPDPVVYAVMEDGTMRIISVDSDNGILAISRWSMAKDNISYGKIKSAAKIRKRYIDPDSVDGEDTYGVEIMATLVETPDGKKCIAYFDEDEENIFTDFYNPLTKKGNDYTSEIETTYAEVIDNQFFGFGSFKKANTAYIRCLHTGHVEVGDDRRQFQKTSYPIGNEDYRIALTGTAKLKYSVIIRAIEDEPMNILAFGYEVMKR